MCLNPIKVKNGEGQEVKVKCGKCDVCRREKAQEWAIKLIKESEYHKKACFITLTFDNKILLDKNSKAVKKYKASPAFVFNIKYSMEYFQRFIKRLRKKYKDTYISYYHVAEYGDKFKRPHHHAIIYGINFEEDRHEQELSKSGHIQYYSKTLEELWACGSISVQDLNPNNTIYISQYTLKKYKNPDENKKWRPLMTFSNRCKIGTKWIRRNYKEILKGYLTDNEGKKYRIPQSYKNSLKNDEINSKYWKTYLQYEQKTMEYFDNITDTEYIEKQRIKNEILKKRAENFRKSRDF